MVQLDSVLCIETTTDAKLGEKLRNPNHCYEQNRKTIKNQTSHQYDAQMQELKQAKQSSEIRESEYQHYSHR